MYAGPKVKKFVGRLGVAGDNNASTIGGGIYCPREKPLWQILILVAPFLILCKRDTELVPKMGAATPARQVSEGHGVDGAYSLWVFKNPKVGSKPPRVFLFLSNTMFDTTIPPIEVGTTCGL